MKSAHLLAATLMIAACGAAGAQTPVVPPNLTTIDPSTLPQYVNISNATPGVTLYWMYGFSPSRNPDLIAIASAAQGPGFYPGEGGFSTGGYNVFAPESGYDPSTTDCLTLCSAMQPDDLSVPTWVDISFTKPVSYVSVLQYSTPGNPAFIQAFNEQNQLIGYCTSNSGGCFTVLPGPYDTSAWQFAISDPTDNIATVLASSYNGDDISRIQFGSVGVPEPATLTLYVLGLAGVGLRRRRKAS